MYPGLHPYIDTYFFVPQEKSEDLKTHFVLFGFSF